MAFESLAHRYTLKFDNFPERWIPLIHLYDPDLPLFPIYYFHALLPDSSPSRPLETERVYGYVERLGVIGPNEIEITVISNKDLQKTQNKPYLNVVETEVKERFGIINPVKNSDVTNAFTDQFQSANRVLNEIWQRVVANSYGNMLPFGRLWDETLGLARFAASWYSQSGRKGELIQTHYFASRFGVPVQSSGDVPRVDFYLLPTIKELTDAANPLTAFPRFSELIKVAQLFQTAYCSLINVEGIDISKFKKPKKGKFNTEQLLEILNGNHIPARFGRAAIECFNAFGKGPQRTVMFLMLLDDVRHGRIKPGVLTSDQCGAIYDGLRNSYQSPKLIEIYAQQSFGNVRAMPVDTWVETFLKWPLTIYPEGRARKVFTSIFQNSLNLGKVERLIWVAAQARKVHSSACDDALWCLKYGSTSKPRGANPLACNICLDAIRLACPAHKKIIGLKIAFNNPKANCDFHIETSAHNNRSSDQSFLSCRGKSIYTEILDDFSPADAPEQFVRYPARNHDGAEMTVNEFVERY